MKIVRAMRGNCYFVGYMDAKRSQQFIEMFAQCDYWVENNIFNNLCFISFIPIIIFI